MNKDERELLRKLHAAGSEGPWTHPDNRGEVCGPRGVWLIADCTPPCEDDESDDGLADAALIVAAVNALPRLLDAIDDMERETGEGSEFIMVNRANEQCYDAQRECERLRPHVERYREALMSIADPHDQSGSPFDIARAALAGSRKPGGET